MLQSDQPVLFFDGHCNLCNGIIRFFIKRDRHQLFKFASLQSGPGQSATRELSLITGKPSDSVILYYNGMFYQKSEAALKALELLGGGWKLTKVFRLLPLRFRDAVYDWISANRYRIFGRKDHCPVPEPRHQQRFLDP